MSVTLRILCVVGAIGTFVLVCRRMRKDRIRIDDSIFWIVFSLTLIVIAIFPNIPAFLAHLLGFQSTSNFVFFATIAVLLARNFSLTLKISALSSRLDELVQEQALQALKEDEDYHGQQ